MNHETFGQAASSMSTDSAFTLCMDPCDVFKGSTQGLRSLSNWDLGLWVTLW